MRNGLIILPLLALLGCMPQQTPQALGTLERDRVSLTATANEIIRKNIGTRGANGSSR